MKKEITKERRIICQYRHSIIQVIVKAVNYNLEAGQAYVGQWHIEGTPAERIVASSIFYYDTSNDIRDSLSFRVRVPRNISPVRNGHFDDYVHPPHRKCCPFHWLDNSPTSRGFFSSTCALISFISCCCVCFTCGLPCILVVNCAFALQYCKALRKYNRSPNKWDDRASTKKCKV